MRERGIRGPSGGGGAIPNVLREIGRLRELTFRGAGEGTGNPLDLDGFDPHYLHLFLWSKAAREVAGAYRLGPTAEILPRFGVRGLYSSTLFHFSAELFGAGPAVELGRSFIRPEYQKQYAPLLLLWKGITRYVASHPECAVLFGAVSISNDYNAASRSLLVSFSKRGKSPAWRTWSGPAGLIAALTMQCGTPWRPQRVRDVEELSAPSRTWSGTAKACPSSSSNT